MAKKSAPTPPSPSSEDDSSSSDEETSTEPAPLPPPKTLVKDKGRDEEEEEDDDEEESDDGKKLPQASAAKPAPESSGSESSESESDSGESDPETASHVTPINSKPMAEVPGAKANGKSLFQRIWTLEDEVILLQSLLDFQSENGPVHVSRSTIGDFYAVIKKEKKLSIEVTSTQLVEKLRRLKKKYFRIAARGARVPNSHDEAVYELGKKLWAGNEEGGVSNGVAADGGGGNLEVEKFPFLKGVVERKGERFLMEGLLMTDSLKAEALDRRIKKQKIEEMKEHVLEAELSKETLRLLMEGMERATS